MSPISCNEYPVLANLVKQMNDVCYCTRKIKYQQLVKNLMKNTDAKKLSSVFFCFFPYLFSLFEIKPREHCSRKYVNIRKRTYVLSR